MAKSNDELRPIECVCTNIKMASRVVGRAYDAAVESEDINITQYSILANIARYQPIEQMRLSEHLDMERTTLYRALDILRKRNLIQTEAATEGVAKFVSLTPAGKALTVRSQKKWKTLHESFLEKFGQTKLDEFNAMLGEIKHHYEGV